MQNSSLFIMHIDLGRLHQQLMHIAKETAQVSKSNYTSDDVYRLQEKVAEIDKDYREAVFDDRDRLNLEDDPYEHPGQGELADELEQIHCVHYKMLKDLQ
ncbi:hypothetical protein BX666DRAFT_1888616 [Dichotomocladium elegans]|nr:hypothetical protein BX666DRAFT_1888616 [Dichotomocladium elegans]